MRPIVADALRDDSLRRALGESGRVYGWDDRVTAERYEAFCRTHDRYAVANAHLVGAAEIRGNQRVLDFAAGTGRSAEAALGKLGPDALVVAVEPARAMREVGCARLRDPRVEWRGELPSNAEFDRVLCGAALWQVADLPRLLRTFRSFLRVGGAFCFTQPSLYLGIPDRPGGGADPELHQLPARLANGRVPKGQSATPLLDLETLTRLLEAAGLVPSFSRFEVRMTQRSLRDWLAIPVLTDALLGDLDVGARDRLLDEAYREVDPESYRWEGWLCCRAVAA